MDINSQGDRSKYMADGIDIRIAVLQRGWIVVGAFRRDGMYAYILPGAVVRRYDYRETSRGLGWLAEKGPCDKVVLEPVTTEIEYHELAGVMTIRCNAEVWAPVLEGLEHE